MLLSLLSLITPISFFAVLIIGLVLSKKYAFRAGFYFFLILLLLELSSIVFSAWFSVYLEKLNAGELELPFNMSIGEFVALRSYIPLLIKAGAFLILVLGIHKKWAPSRETGE